MQGFEDIEERLNNWACWARSGDGIQPNGCVSMYNILEAANLYVPVRGPKKALAVIDEKDAWIVDRAIVEISFKSRRVIKTMWITCPHGNCSLIAKRAGVRRQNIDEVYRNALSELKTRLEAKKGVSGDFGKTGIAK